MKRVQHGKSATGSKCNMKQHEKKSDMKKVQHVQKCKMKRVQHEQMQHGKVQHEKSATQK